MAFIYSPINACEILKKKITPKISAMEVMSGELAVAGSSLKTRKIKGKIVPKKLPATTTAAIESATLIPIKKPPRYTPTRETARPIVKPNIIETRRSLRTTSHHCFKCTSPVAKADNHS